MYFAPNVSNEDLGGAIPKPEDLRYFKQHGHWRRPVSVCHTARPHGYTVQFLGGMEREAINKEYDGMLGKLCKIKDLWCLRKDGQ